MNHYDEFLLGAPIQASQLLRELQALKTLARPVTTGELLLRYQNLDNVHFEFSTLCEDVGDNDLGLEETKERFAADFTAILETLAEVSTTASMKLQTARLIGQGAPAFSKLRNRGCIVAAVHFDGDSQIPLRLFDIVYQQHRILEADGKGIMRIPAWMLSWCSIASGGLFDPLDGDEESIETLAAALTLWEPYDETTPLGSFAEAVATARII